MPSSWFCTLSFSLRHPIERISWHTEYQVADWASHCRPWQTLVARCACPLVSAAGFVSWVGKGLSGWTDGEEEIAEWVLSLTRVCHSFCLFLCSSLPGDCWCCCPVSVPILWCHLPCYVLHLDKSLLIFHVCDWHYSVRFFIILPQTLAKLDLSDASWITEVHTGWWMCTAQEWKKSLFNFSVDCVCCRMLRGRVWKTYITRYDTEVCEGWSLEVFFLSLLCPITLLFLWVMNRSCSVMKWRGAVCCRIWGAPSYIWLCVSDLGELI